MDCLKQIKEFLKQHNIKTNATIDFGTVLPSYLLSYSSYNDFEVMTAMSDVKIRSQHARYILFVDGRLTYDVYGLTQEEEQKMKKNIKQKIIIYKD